MKRVNKFSIYKAVLVVICIALNTGLAFIIKRLGLPLYLDTVGTVFMSALGGAFPGILTAVVTSVMCTPVNNDALYYMLISILISLSTAWYVRSGKHKKIGNLPGLIVTQALIAGILGALFQWLMLGRPQFGVVGETAKLLAGDSSLSYAGLQIFLMVVLNLVDKGIATISAFLVFYLIPEAVRNSFWNSGWEQKPLSNEEIREINIHNARGRQSLRFTIAMIFTAATLILVLLLSWISNMTYVNFELSRGEEEATRVAELAAKIIPADMVNEYVRSGETVKDYDAEDYRETNEMLLNIRESVSNLEYLYVYQIREDGCHIVFDTDENIQENGSLGDLLEFDEAFMKYVPTLLAGGRIEPIRIKSRYGYFITAYVPVYSSTGVCVAYVGADMSIDAIRILQKRYLINMILAFSGFFVLIVWAGLWISGHHLVYPISSMAKSTKGFMRDINNQDRLDESVKQLRRLDIRTGDEVEDLYRSICEMAGGTAEQMRSIRHLAQSTVNMQNGLIITMADMVENRDSDTGAHVQKTAAYVRIILEGLKRKGYYSEKITDKYIEYVVMSAPLHDVGKITVPDAILNKPGKLTDEEFEIMKTHTTAGKMILEKAISTVQDGYYLKEARNMAAYHHEHWDGKGYPEKLHGQVIPLSARVMAVADVFDALASPRIYKPAFPLEKALEIIQEGSGTQFDPKCVEAFMDSLTEVKQVLKKYQG